MRPSPTLRTSSGGTGKLTGIGQISGFPFDKFDELQAAVKAKSFNLGVDSLAAAEWANRSGGRINRTAVACLSVLLIAVGLASIVAGIAIRNWWLLMAIPVQALSFYLSQPTSPIRKWVTVAGALSLAVFLNLLFNGLLTAATLVAYAGLTFSAVRAAGFITNSAFRKALLSNEEVFLEAYRRGECSLRNNRTSREHRT